MFLSAAAPSEVSQGAVIRAAFQRCEQDWATLVGIAFNQI